MTARRTVTANGQSLAEERDARLKVIKEAATEAGIPYMRDESLTVVQIPDCTAHEVQIPAALFIALCHVKTQAERITTAAVKLGSVQREDSKSRVAFNAALADLQKELADQVERLGLCAQAARMG